MIYQHKQFNCPICKELIGPFAREITFHAQNHQLTTSEFWLIVHNLIEIPRCKCGCGMSTSFHSWKIGFKEFYKRHKPREIKNIIYPSGKDHWAFGKTNKNDEKCRLASEKRSKTLKLKHKNGIIKQWNKGLTKDTHLSIQSISEKNKNCKHHFYNRQTLDLLLNDKLTNNFVILTNKEIIYSRQNVNDCFVDIQCTRCNLIKNISVYNIIRKSKQKCHNCDVFESSFEKEIKQFLEQELLLKTTKTNIENIEIDIYVPTRKFAIECNGLYWHSSLVQKNPYQHQYKIDICNKNNIELIHIFEDEWRLKQNIIKNFLKNKLNITTIQNLDFLFKNITCNEANLFFKQNYFNDEEVSCNNSLFVGCFVNNELYDCIEFDIHLNKCNIIKYITTQNILFDLFIDFIKKFFNVRNFTFKLNQRFGSLKTNNNWKLIEESCIETWYTNRVLRTKQQIIDEDIKIYGCKNLTYELTL